MLKAKRCGLGFSTAGFTLVEVCVAIAIVAMGILTSMSILLPALKWASDANNELTVGVAAQNAIEAVGVSGIGSLAAADPYTYTADPFHVRFYATASVTDPTNITYDGSGVITNGTVLTPAADYYANCWVAVYKRSRNPDTAGYKTPGSGTKPIYVARVDIYRRL